MLRNYSRGVKLVLPLLLVLCCITADTGELSGGFRKTVINLSDSQRVSSAVGTGRPREMVSCTEIPSPTGSPVIAVAKMREVWYVDSGDGSVLRKLEFAQNESVIISQNGKYVAVFSRIYNRRTGITLHKMRVEDWRGERQWEMKFRRMLACEPTPTGGFVAYPTTALRDDDMIDASFFRNSDPSTRGRGLLVYDNHGNLILQGISEEECRAGTYYGSISPDGRYLALLFIWVPPAFRDSRYTGADQPCLILYDLERGEEKWRRYLDGSCPTDLCISSMADRIVCFAGRGGGCLGTSDFKMYLLDRDGALLSERIVRGCESAPPRELRMSADGQTFAFRTIDNRVHAYRSSDGSELWDWGSDSRTVGRAELGLSSGGTVIILALEGQDRLRPKLVLIGEQGTPDVALDAAFVEPNLAVTLGIADDASAFWVLHKNELAIFRPSTMNRLDGGGQQ